MESAFRTRTRAVVEAFEAYEEFRQDLNEQRSAFATRYGAGAVMVNRMGFGHGTVVRGLPGDKDTEAPEGWRYSKQAGHLIPNLRKKAGKDIDAEMNTLVDHGPSFPGMPEFNLYGLHSHAPSLFRWQGYVYAGWACPMAGFYSIDAKDKGGKVDLTIWDQIKVSEWYQAVEGEREAKARAEVST